MRHLIIIGLAIALSGCAGMTSPFGGTTAGSATASSAHVDQALSKSGCPDFRAAGSVQVAGLSASCSDSPTMGHNESFTVQSADPNQALATAFNAQVMQTQKLMDTLGPILQAVAPFLLTAASGGVIPPIPHPIVPTPAPVATCPEGKNLVVTSAGAVCQ